MINDLTGIKEKKTQKEKEEKSKKLQNYGQNHVNYVCLECNVEEKIPLSVVQDFDAMDDGDPTIPPQFSCQKCSGEMYPEYYKGVHRYIYKISDVR